MPKKVFRRRYQKLPMSKEQKILQDIDQIIHEHKEKKAQQQKIKELAKQELSRIKLGKDRRNAEKYNWIRADKWTGLRIPPDNEIEGRNWMTYICLHRKQPNFPADVMFLVNQFLNWVPAGCWYANMDNGCDMCGIRFLDLTIHAVNVCSFQCQELCLRSYILMDYDTCIKAACGFKRYDLPYVDFVFEMATSPGYPIYHGDHLYNYITGTNDMLELCRYDGESSDMMDSFFPPECSSSDNSDGPDIESLELELENVRNGIDDEDDIWTTHYSRWKNSESMIFVFPYKSRRKI